MVSVMGCTINKWLQQTWNTIVTVVYRHSPEIHHHKKTKIQHFMQWKQEWVYMIGAALQEPVQWVEGVTGKGSGNLPLVVSFVHSLVHQRMVQEAMNPVDEAVGEYNERAGADYNCQPSSPPLDTHIELGIAAYFEQKSGRGVQNH